MAAKKNEFGLTDKQEKFAQEYIRCKNASEAYRNSYNAGKMSDNVIHTKAYEVLKNGAVTVRLNELRGEIKQRHNITVDSLVKELEQARQVALAAETPQTSAAVAATMGKAKLCGLDKQLVELSGEIKTTDITDEELKEKLNKLGMGRFANQLVNKQQ
jgi:phage terminase small subunit